MREIINEKQLELISASLDGVLSINEKRSLNEELESNLTLKEAYDSLYQTRALIQGLPQKPIPRSFTLTQDMVQTKFRMERFLSPFFGTVSVLAAFFFALSYILGGSLRTPQSAALEAPALEMAAAPVPTDLEAEPTPMIITWGGPAYGYGKGGGGGMDPGQAMMAPATAERAEAEANPTDERPQMMMKENLEPIAGSGPILGIQESVPKSIERPATSDDVQLELEAPSRDKAENSLVQIRYGLLILALISAAAAMFSGRKTRRL